MQMISFLGSPIKCTKEKNEKNSYGIWQKKLHIFNPP